MGTYKIGVGSTLRQAMMQLANDGSKSLVVLNDDHICRGIISNGDVRNAILAGFGLDEPVTTVFRSNFKFMYDHSIDQEVLWKYFTVDKLDLVPILNKDKKLIKVLAFEDVDWSRDLPFEVKGGQINELRITVPLIIFAGGTGSRIKPFTDILPKPLVPLNTKPVMQYIFEYGARYGVKQFMLLTHFKSYMIEAYLENEEVGEDISVEVVRERSLMGTAGGLSLLRSQLPEIFFVTNCDILTKVDLTELYDFCERSTYDMVIVGASYTQRSSYGVIDMNDDGSLKKIREKPSHTSFASVGLYCVRSTIFAWITDNKHLDMDTLIDRVSSQGGTVGIYTIPETDWIDVGRWDSYHEATHRLDSFYNG